MKLLIYMSLLSLIVLSCQSTKYMPVESTRAEYKTREVLQQDSIVLKDSIYVYAKNDTIYKTKIRYQFRYLTINKSDTIMKSDSILVPYPIEKKLTKWQSIKIEIGGWSLGGILIMIIAIGSKYIIKRNFY